MNKKLGYAAAAALGAVALLGTTALPASAATTEVTFALAGGALVVSAPVNASLGTFVPGTTSITGALGSVTVTDTRGGNTDWSVSTSSPGFIYQNDPANTSSRSGTIYYNAGTFTKTGTVTVTNLGDKQIYGASYAVASGTNVNGANSATFAPTLAVAMPASALAGTYTGTVTTSVA